jgi:hypothetical protein
MATITLLLLAFAFVLFVLAAWWVQTPPRINLIAAGLACWVLSALLGGVHLPL